MNTPQDSPSTPKRRRAPKLSRDQRLQVLTLQEAGHKQKDIATRLKITIDQVKKTTKSGRVSPKKSTGRHPKLSPAQVDELVEYVCSSRETRRMSFLELAVNFPQWNVGEDAIRNALRRRGYVRRLSRKKSPFLDDK